MNILFKLSIIVGFSIINDPFGDTPIPGNPHLFFYPCFLLAAKPQPLRSNQALPAYPAS